MLRSRTHGLCVGGLQPVVKPVEQPVECLFTRRSRLFNRLDNRLYRVNGVLESQPELLDRIAVLRKCSLLLQTEYRGLSVCLSVCRSVCHSCEPCKNG